MMRSAFVLLLAAGITLAGCKQKSDAAADGGSAAKNGMAPGYQQVVEVRDDNFDQLVRSGKPVLVEFAADWCGPCKKMKPALESLASSHKGKLTVGRLDVDHSTRTTSMFRVQVVPTLLVFANGKLVAEAKGALELEDLTKLVAPAFATASDTITAKPSAN